MLVVLAEPVLDAELAGELADLAAFAVVDEGDADAWAAGSAGSADAVDVSVVVIGRIEVDHV
jgi:hypothetical protein